MCVIVILLLWFSLFAIRKYHYMYRYFNSKRIERYRHHLWQNQKKNIYIYHKMLSFWCVIIVNNQSYSRQIKRVNIINNNDWETYSIDICVIELVPWEKKNNHCLRIHIGTVTTQSKCVLITRKQGRRTKINGKSNIYVNDGLTWLEASSHAIRFLKIGLFLSHTSAYAVLLISADISYLKTV